MLINILQYNARYTQCQINTWQASNPLLLNGNDQIKLHNQAYLQEKAQENDIRFVVFWNKLKEATFFLMKDTFSFLKRNSYYTIIIYLYTL